MHNIVINTGPIIALVAATESLEWLPSLYSKILIPSAVRQELEAGGLGNPETLALGGIRDLICIQREVVDVPAALLRELDRGEASVIYAAELNGINTVAIDEKAGRRLARIHGLRVTGSLGILLKAKRLGIIESFSDCIIRMSEHGIWISEDLIQSSLQQAGEA